MLTHREFEHLLLRAVEIPEPPSDEDLEAMIEHTLGDCADCAEPIDPERTRRNTGIRKINFQLVTMGLAFDRTEIGPVLYDLLARSK